MKILNEEELMQHIDNAISNLKNVIINFKNSNKKRAILLGYWISDYASYVSQEDTYQYPKYKYERGDVVQVNFGYRIGREIGGRHFAVVIENSNSIKQQTLTVVPLMSLKETSKDGKYTFTLNTGLYELHNNKLNKLMKEFEFLSKEIDSLMKDDNPSEEKAELIKSKLSKSKRVLKELKSFEKSLEKLKTGSIIDIGQIVTISKMRISNPKNSKDSLSKIKLSNEDLDKLNEKLITLYVNKHWQNAYYILYYSYSKPFSGSA